MELVRGDASKFRGDESKFDYYGQGHGIRPNLQGTKNVFSNHHVDLSRVDVFGFDYDYTLIEYRETMQELLYDV